MNPLLTLNSFVGCLFKFVFDLLNDKYCSTFYTLTEVPISTRLLMCLTVNIVRHKLIYSFIFILAEVPMHARF